MNHQIASRPGRFIKGIGFTYADFGLKINIKRDMLML